jgi:hypothetical protein
MAKAKPTKKPRATAYTGGCLCGAVRFRVTGVPLHVSHCHCTMCRRASGAPVVTFTRFPLEGFALTKGKPKEYRSSPKNRRGFCGKCGGQIYFKAGDKPDSIGLNVGCFDRPETLTPTRHIYVGTMIPWMHMRDGLPRHKDHG